MSGLSVAAAAPTHPSGCAFAVTVTATPTTGLAPLTVRFNASVSTGAPTAYDWSFGDGAVFSSRPPAGASPYHSYEAPGTYDATVEVTEAGCTAPGSATVTIGTGPIVVVLRATPSSGPAPLTVQFNASANGGTGTYESALWQFGDGGTGSGLGVRYTYASAGSYLVRVNVTDSSGHWGVASDRIEVQASNGPAPTGTGLLPALILGTAAIAGLGLYLGIRWRSRPEAEDAPEPPAPSLPAPPTPEGDRKAVGPDGSTPSTSGPGSLGTEPGTNRARRPPDDRVRLTEQVILHLGRQEAVGPDGIGVRGRTQGGMVDMLRTGQNSLTNVLRRLEAAGVVTARVRHVRGAPRRLKVYELTPRGESLLRDLRSRAGAEPPGARPASEGPGPP